MDQVLAVLLETQPLRLGGETAPDLASALYRCVDAWLHTQVEDPTTIPVRYDPDHLPPATRETLRQIDDLIASRVRAVIGTAVGTEPAWRTAVGPMPDDDAGALAWQQQVAAIAAQLDRTSQPGPAGPIPAPATDPAANLDWSRSL